MIYTTITKMTFKLPEEYIWSFEVEKGYKDMGMCVKVYDGSTISRTLEVTESYHMDMPIGEMMVKEECESNGCRLDSSK